MELQEIHLVESVSLIENLALIRAMRGLGPDRAEDLYWLDRLGIAHLADRRATTCSGGERQRLALVRALVGQPPVVVLDEPSSQLDEAAVEHLAIVLRDVATAGAALVVATHDEVLIDQADDVLWLDGSGS
jgi:putative ABC transport system ATP-binding protein